MACIYCDRCDRLIDLDWDVEHMDDHEAEEAEEEKENV